MATAQAPGNAVWQQNFSPDWSFSWRTFYFIFETRFMLIFLLPSHFKSFVPGTANKKNRPLQLCCNTSLGRCSDIQRSTSISEREDVILSALSNIQVSLADMNSRMQALESNSVPVDQPSTFTIRPGAGQWCVPRHYLWCFGPTKDAGNCSSSLHQRSYLPSCCCNFPFAKSDPSR